MAVPSPAALLPSPQRRGQIKILGLGGGISPGDDPQVVRAEELRGVGQLRAAGCVEGCGVRYPTCQQRTCPRCAERRARQRRGQACRLIQRMGHPYFFTATIRVPVGHVPRLDRFRDVLFKLRHRDCFDVVRAGVGGLELRLSKDGRFWDLHAHVVLDLTGRLSVAAVDAAWRELTRSRRTGRHQGRFLPHPRRPAVDRANAWVLGRYLSKARGWCPPPGEIPLERFDEWRQAVRSVRLPISWGGKAKRAAGGPSASSTHLPPNGRGQGAANVPPF